MAAILHHSPLCIAEITFLTAIPATPSTPHFTLSGFIWNSSGLQRVAFPKHSQCYIFYILISVLCYLCAPMKLACKSQYIGDVVVVRCEGRIVAGEEVQS